MNTASKRHSDSAWRWQNRAVNAILTGALLLLVLSCNAATLQGRVVAVGDGDSITVVDAGLKQHKIRLSGIDAPETMQPFGRKSKFSLSDLLYFKQVSVEAYKQDRYGRAVAKVWVDGVDANLAQVQRGMAWHDKVFAHEQAPADRKVYADAENEAKTLRRGLWAGRDPVPPWEFRRRK